MEARKEMSTSLKCKSVLVTAVVVFVFGSAVYGDPWAGSGTEGDPYQIHNAAQMQAIGADANYWNAHFLLMADIDLGAYTGTNFNIIGTMGNPFTGVFDGNGHTISNFTYGSNGIDHIGLFRYIDTLGAGIKDLGLIDPNVDAGTGSLVGGLAAKVDDATIDNCYVTGGSISGNEIVGGLVGRSTGVMSKCYSNTNVSGLNYIGGLVALGFGEVNECYSAGNASGNNSVGGLAGKGGNIHESFSSCDVFGTGSSIGGLVGTGSTDKILNCYATGSVTGVSEVGGLVGAKGGFIINSYSMGSVTGESYVGGLTGRGVKPNYVISPTLNCFWDVNTSGQTDSAGGTGKTTSEMRMMSTYLGWGCEATVWTIDEGNDYPRLGWEVMAGVPVSPQIGELVSGAGVEGDPYLIYTVEELNLIGLFACEWDKQFKLLADVDLSGLSASEFNIIGAPFDGVFDGDGHTISNFSYDSNGLSYIGLFGYVNDANAEIRNLGLVEPNVDGSRFTGSLVGRLQNGSITNCYTDGGYVSGKTWVGGLAGISYYSNISNCYSSTSVTAGNVVGGLVGENGGKIESCWSSGSISGDGYVGGLVGENHTTISESYSVSGVSGDYMIGGLVGAFVNGEMSNCYAKGSVTGKEEVGGLVGFFDNGEIRNCYAKGGVLGTEYVGGLLGRADRYTIVTNCYSTGSITGTHNIGGLVGRSSGNIEGCYSTGSVTGEYSVGGLIGYDYQSDFYTACFWDSDVNPDVNGIGNTTDPNVVGLPTVLMQAESTFTDAGWDFVGEVINGPNDIWDICEGTNYPKLVWSIPAGDFICPDGVNMLDFAILGDAWFSDPNMGNWDPACDISEPNDNLIDGLDLGVFTDNYLEGM